jgi:CopA family copper-resistance protein
MQSDEINGLAPANASRRAFVKGVATAGAAAGLGLWRTGLAAQSRGAPAEELRGSEFSLSVGETTVNFTGSEQTAFTVNGSLPAPTLRWREGDTVTIRVSNTLRDQGASIHWHGLLLPANMDGVPGLSFPGIRPGETYTYRFPVKQAGTYWYHSHSGFQEQRGLYGALIIDPRDPPPFSYDRELVVLLSEWTDIDPKTVLAKLKKQSDYFNYRQRTVGDFFRDVREVGLSQAVADRRMWATMRMNPTDLADVTGATYTYLMNGAAPGSNWTGLFKAGERVRLRFINGSAQSYFDVRIPGLKLTIVAADGLYVRPVEVDEFRIATAETYDVIVEPSGAEAFTIFAQSLDRSGYAAGTLAVAEGLRAPVPALDPPQLLTMADMGHGDMGHEPSATAPASNDPHAAHAAPAVSSAKPVDPHAGHGAAPQKPADPHAGHDMPPPAGGTQMHPDTEDGNPLVDMQAASPAPRLDDPGVGLRGNGRRVLTYSQLQSVFDDPDGREPGRTIELHLTGHMEKFTWHFNGVKFSDAAPIRLKYGERLRLVLVNDTMMSHPIHLHGMWSDLEDEQGRFLVRKHTIDMPPGTRRSYRIRADALGRWAYHCHLLYHMESGMFREVRVEE